MPLPFALGVTIGWKNSLSGNASSAVVVAFGHVIHVVGRPDFVYSADPRILAAKYRRAFPGLVLTVQCVDMDSDRITVRWSLCGASLGAFAGLAPTGRTHEVSGTFVFRFADDQVTETWVVA